MVSSLCKYFESNSDSSEQDLQQNPSGPQRDQQVCEGCRLTGTYSTPNFWVLLSAPNDDDIHEESRCLPPSLAISFCLTLPPGCFHVLHLPLKQHQGLKCSGMQMEMLTVWQIPPPNTHTHSDVCLSPLSPADTPCS